MSLPHVFRPIILTTAFSLVLPLAGCATIHGHTEGSPTVSCSLLSPAEVWGYATSDEANPFLAPSGLLRGTPEEVIALRLTMSLPEEAYVKVSASAHDGAGNTLARLYDARELRDLWKRWGDDETNSRHMQRAQTLDRWCLPSTGFIRRAGRAEYVMVLVGTTPLPRPIYVDVMVAVGGAEPDAFTLTLPQ